MSKRVRIEQFDQDVMVEDGDTILQAALDAGLDYPFMCQQGQCGACKSQLISGSVDLGTYYNPMILTDEEKASGQILACQAEPQSDCVVSIGVLDGEVSHVVRTLDYEVVSAEAGAEAIVLRLRGRSPEPFHFSAGQFARLSFGDAGSLEAGMANRPDDKVLEFHLPRIDHPLSRHVAGLVAGAIVKVEGPFGAAYLREEHLGPIILAGAGADSAMLLTVAETALKSGMAQQISLYAGGDSAIASRALDLQSRYRNFRWRPVAIDPTAPVDQLWSAIEQAFDDFDGCHVYLAGGWSEALCERFVARGLPRESCHFDVIESIG